MKITYGEKLFQIFNYVILAAAAATMLMPLVQLLAVSFSSPIAADSKQVFLLPVEFTTASWVHILQNKGLWTSFGITVYITVAGTLLSMLFSLLTAYPLSRKEFLVRKPIMLGIIITMIFNAPMIPFFLTVRELGLMNSLWSLILPGLIGTFNMIIIRTFFQGIPGELDDSARIDGCSDAGILFRIYLPLSKPVLATVSLFYAVGYWNTFQRAVLFIRDPNKWPLQMKLRAYLTSPEELAAVNLLLGDYAFNTTTLKAATILFATVPILLVYPYLQKYFVKGAMLGSLKE
ncbi:MULTISPECIES: carbohydrate ABC transporter permease [unclassified Paenibacillus]|jgi:ABC-type glycerol-3-phosphate transport system permease component|uniref:carbohydrate ABC transporter permease n=1 Tax=unclassified Paenibacillus TaxID=185978 RepID=UPI00277D608C|nr:MULTISPECIES: carbohydrate ABC transporter permease [unclassified Paenibacillus]MDF2668380.1 transporter permease [Paenibacillus sp.]MDQ0900970.1 putative aldouronate transport system permease protein [Paenibacillus sp. V4I7]MDQ0920530.1 putative aldouronate transport system permease protein [Paenibacillus sp. V4I5]